ncbi:MAG: LacI family transcriptional regulator [Flavobacteriales bacterium]|jgi:LacI family transcriptional regulator|tara:strand:+ start:981 stop:1994 length:1014 start_codon:yes stop_codon:yes gene_type:complete
MKKLTIKDIAENFGVSISTVSKALNDSHEISEATKEKINKYAKEHNYKPNFNAINLKNRSTKTIGIIIPNMLNYFFAQVFKGIENVANKKGYKVITCISNESYSKEVEIIEMLSNGSVDGFILSLAKETELEQNFKHIQNTIDDGTPIVMFDRTSDNVKCDKVIVDDYNSALCTVDFLAKKGHENIAFISTLSNLQIGKQRFLGYEKGLKNAGLKFNPNLVIDIFEKDYKKYETILAPLFKNNKIDSVIALGESAAIAAMKAAIKNGLDIPRDISVIAFSNGILARHSSPKLTTVSQHGEIMGETAAKILIEKLEKKQTQIITKVIKTDLVIRNSTR